MHGFRNAGGTSDSASPQFLDLEKASGMPGAYASLVAAGGFHTLVLLRLPAATSTGAEAAALFGCGRNVEGQLGLGQTTVVGRYGNAVVAHDVRDRDLLTATPMFGRGMNSNDPVVGIGAGGWHTLLLLRSGQAWVGTI